jgi:hypothetical protein
MAAWVKPAVTGIYGSIMNREGEYEVGMLNGELAWAISNTSPGWYWRTTGQVPAVGVWTHVAVTYNGSNIITYINGTAQNTQPGNGNIVDASTPENDFRIGSRQCNICNEYFKGGIDEVQVYNRALSATERELTIECIVLTFTEEDTMRVAATVELTDEQRGCAPSNLATIPYLRKRSLTS